MAHAVFLIFRMIVLRDSQTVNSERRIRDMRQKPPSAVSDAEMRSALPLYPALDTGLSRVSGITVQTRRVAQSPTAARPRKAASLPRWSAIKPAAVVLKVAPPPIASPTAPSAVV
jgi:hypothetical protein